MHNYLESFFLGRENLSFFEDGEQYKSMAKQLLIRLKIGRRNMGS